MIRILVLLLVAFNLTLFSSTTWAGDTPVVKPNSAKRFATLPGNLLFPEGISANPATGDIFVSTFSFGPTANALLRFSKSGKLLTVLDFGGAPLLGLTYNPLDDKVYIANFGASEIQRVHANFTAGSVVETVAVVPGIGAPTPRVETNNPDGSQDIIIFGSNNIPAPNGLTFDEAGALYVSDSFHGAIYRINAAHLCAPCTVDNLAHDPLLATAGFPPFGANGIDLNADESALFIANTGDDRVLRLDLSTGEITVFAESINGADGIAFDDAGRLWVAANQADQVTVLDDTGRVIAELGEFLGVKNNGTARGLSFPASLVILGNKVFVTNLALPLTGSADPENDVTRHTVSRIGMPPL